MSRKHMRLPNGFGQITELKNRRLRNPFRAMVTVGKPEEGRPICKLLQPVAYFKTYNEAYKALLIYNSSKSVISNLTVKELHDEWFEQYKDGVAIGTVASMNNAWGFVNIKDIKISMVRTSDIRDCIERDEIAGSTKKIMKILLNLMFDYALRMEYIDHNCVSTYKIPKNVTKKLADNYKAHKDYTPDEISMLWEHSSEVTPRLILIQIYSGWRPIELVNLKLENINIKDGYMIGGTKTKSGTNRMVPIHSKIKGLVEEAMTYASSIGLKTLCKSYDAMSYSFKKMKDELNISRDHSLHDGRVTFVTLAKESGVDEYAIKRIVGHSIADLTERVYTRRTFAWLKEEIEKIK